MTMRIKRFFLLVTTVILFALCGLLAACGGELGAVNQSSIKYDGKLITWTAVEGAEKYSVSINGGKEYTTSVSQFAWPVGATEERVEISVKALKDDEASDAAVKLFTRLEKIDETSITFDENGKMSWGAVAGATEYALKINGKEIRTYQLEYTEFEQGKTNTISIMPVGPDDSTFSDWSTTMTKDYLGAPTNLKYDGQMITFTGNNYAAKYKIYINNVEYDETTSTTYVFDANNATFDLQLQSIGDGKRSFNSPIGEAKRFVFLKDIEGFTVSDGVLTWNEVPEASAYKVKLNGTEQTVETNKLENLPAGRENAISVKPITGEGEAYFANWSEEQRVRLLVAPKLQWQEGLNLDGQTANALFWDKVDGDVGGYNVKVKNPNGDTEIIQLGADAIQYGNAFEMTGEYEISIQTAPVADSNSYQSAYSLPVKVIRLATPNRAMQNFIKSNPTRVSEGFELNWQNVSGAVGYQIYKDGKKLDGTTSTTNTKIPYNSIIDADTTEAQTFEYQIQALGSEKTFVTERYVTLSSLSADMLTAEVQVLAQPQNLILEGYTASWSTVDSAKGYAVNCTGESTVPDTRYDLSNLEAGTYNDFGVCAMGNGSDLLASNYTPAKKLVRLEAPHDIHLIPDSNGDTLAWKSGNSNADHYEVFWNDEPNVAVDADQIGDIGQYITTQSRGLFMRAAANYEDLVTGTYYITSKPSDTVTFTKLQPVTFNAVKVVGQKLVWNAPANVNNVPIQYRVYDNSGVARDGIVNACEYDISTLPAGSYSFRVTAIGDGKSFVSSEKSAAVSFTKLETPVVTTPANSTSLTWDAVPGEVVQYVVEIDGEIVDQIKPVSGKLTYTCEYKYSEIKTNGYAVRVYAQGDGIDTVDSNAWTKTQMVKAALAPGFEMAYCDQNMNKLTENVANAWFVITIKNLQNNYTTGYEIEIDGTTKFVEIAAGETTTFTYKPDQTGEFTARVYATGGMYDNNGVYFVRSVTENKKTMTVFAEPVNVEPSSSAINWNVVSGASQYLVRYWINGVMTEKTVKGASHTLVTGTGDLIEKVEVQALGNGSTTISSTVATWTRT